MTEQPSKLYYTISEVAKLTGVKAHVLRYWESEFPTLRPRKTRSGSRRYRQKDIDEVLAIKTLLYDEGYRIAGARKMRRTQQQAVREEQSAAAGQLRMSFSDLDAGEQLKQVREELQSLLGLVRELKVDVEPSAKSGKPRLAEAEGEA